MTDDYDFDNEYDGVFCPKCCGIGSVPCHCGGDLCFCANNGEQECSLCGGKGLADRERADKYEAREREFMAEMQRMWKEAGKATR